MRVKAGTEGKVKDVAITDVTPENYIVPSNEQHLYHCIIEVRKFDSESGKRLSVPRIQKFGKKSFENGVGSNLKKQGYTVTILHDPADYLKQQAEEKAKTATAKAQAAADAKAKEAADTKAALKAEIMEELKAAGIIPTGDNTAKAQAAADAKAKEAADTKAGAKK